MKEYTPAGMSTPSERIREFIINNFNGISSSIKSILTQVRINKNDIENITIQAWPTTNRPKSTPESISVGINTTTGSINYTTDSGKNWKNYDGTAA